MYTTSLGVTGPCNTIDSGVKVCVDIAPYHIKDTLIHVKIYIYSKESAGCNLLYLTQVLSKSKLASIMSV